MNSTKQLTDTLAWSASGNPTLDLSKEGFLTELDVAVSVTSSASQASDAATFALWRAIQSLNIKGGGGKDYFNMSGVQMGVLMHYLNLVDFPGKTWREIAATTHIVVWKIHFGSRPYDVFGRHNPFDLTAAIPAMDETNIKLTWGCPANNVLDDTITLSSATMRVTEHRVLPQSFAEERAIKAGLFIPTSSCEAYDPGATKSALSGQRYAPTGNFLKRIAIAAQNDTAVGSFGPLFVGDQVTELGVKLAKANTWIIDGIRTDKLQMSNPKFDGMEVVNTPNTQSPWAPAGFYNLDFRQYGHQDYGLDTRGLGSNDVILAMTIGAYATGEVEQIFYEQYEKYAK